jgi:hypothetical protein
MRAANVIAGIAIAIWFGLALVGRDLLNGVVEQEALGYPTLGQIDFLLAWPLLIVSAILLCAWICNAFGRWAWALGSLSGLSLAAVLPYLLVYGGGV